jgi:chaperonin GroES
MSTAKKLNIRPLYDRVIVKRAAEETKTASGIIIPDNAKEKPTRGEVLAVGKGAVKQDGSIRPLELKVGDHVLFAKWGGNEVKIEGEEVLILKEEDILAVVNA